MPKLAHPFRALVSRLSIRWPNEDPETIAESARVLAFALAMIVWVPLFAIIYTLLGSPICAHVILLGGTLLLGVVTLLLRGVAPAICGNLMTGAAWFVYTALACLTGGLSAPVMPWYATLPILSVLLSGTRSGAFWTAITILTVTWFAVARQLGILLPIEVSVGALRLLQFTGMVGVLLCVYLLVGVLKRMEHLARQALHEANCDLELQATTDSLTGIPNRHRFDEEIEHEWNRHERAGVPLSLALIDADFFKAFNDEYGHLAGDECLRLVARAIKDSIRRPTDFCARFGGEEFVVILPNTDDVGAMRVAELIREHVREMAIAHACSPISPFVTVSIGISTTIPVQGRSHLLFVHDVDMALYRAKALGRDQIVQASSVATQEADLGCL
ncbi:MAG: GGDEF domain-containing protein [Planctomycetota bacterium]|nr:MAG: GGDEF domain-containing protein [Planctomycetota bacterium]